jgi:nucleoid-associated protein YgaU
MSDARRVDARDDPHALDGGSDMRSTRFAFLALASAVIFTAAPAVVAGDPLAEDQPTVIKGPVPESNAPALLSFGREVVVEHGDTLATIAERELGSTDKWQLIAQANGILDPSSVRVGQKLKIPSDQEHDEQFRF